MRLSVLLRSGNSDMAAANRSPRDDRVHERDTGAHGICAGELVAEFAMDLTGIRSSGGVLRFESVEFFKHLDGYPDVVVLEMEHGERVVDEDVGIEDEILDIGGSSHGFAEFAHGVRLNATETCWIFGWV